MKWKRISAAALGAATLLGVLTPTVVKADELKDGDWFQTTVQLSEQEGPQKIWAMAHQGRGIWQGDIDLGPVDKLTGAQPLSGTKLANKWPGGIVPYEIGGTVAGSDRTMVQNGIQHINDTLVNVTWRPRVPADPHYVRFEIDGNALGCGTSAIGKSKPAEGDVGFQRIKYKDSSCLTTIRTVTHEMLHATGAYHEHTRSDRDTYVTIYFENIEENAKYNFCVPNATQCPPGKPQTPGPVSVNWGNYDYKSVMHYPSDAFGKLNDNNKPKTTIKSKNGTPIAPSNQPTGLDRDGMEQSYSPLKYNFPAPEKKDFGSSTSSFPGSSGVNYSSAKHIRMVTDMTGDGKADVFVFGDGGVILATNNGSGGFKTNRTDLHEFGYNQNWRTDQHVRLVGNIAGSPLPDIVGFGGHAVLVAKNLGNDGDFATPQESTLQFTYDQNWRVDRHERQLADVNGDGYQDIVAFGENGTYTALSKGDGTFGPSINAVAQFGYAQAWRVGTHVRTLADLDKDGKLDIVGFGDSGVWFSHGNGNGTFQTRILLMAQFGKNQGYTGPDYPRFVADMNADNKPDIVGFGAGGVYISFQGASFNFAAPKLIEADLGYNQGWRAANHDRYIGDLNGDGRNDIIGFGSSALQGLLQQPSSVANSAGTFLPVRRFLNFFGAGWGKNLTSPGSLTDQPRFLADVNGDKKLDPGAFGSTSVWVAPTGPATGLS